VTAYVATFYSFKGGVGRTTLLVNVAHALAAAGERVVIWDLDLEAPGVHLFPGLEPPERLWQSGLLEWLADTPACPDGEPTAAWPSEAWLAALGDRVYRPRRDERGEILVVPAHGTSRAPTSAGRTPRSTGTRCSSSTPRTASTCWAGSATR
jgi:hypothetical protein